MNGWLKKIMLLVLILGTGFYASAQDKDDESEYTREFVWGINKNTNGGYIGGLNLKFARYISSGLYRTIGFEIANVKHPKEARFPSFSGGTYILGKQNYLYSLRFNYGFEKILFKKGPQQGVQVNALAAAGPTIGVIAPYYVEYAPPASRITRTAPYDPDNKEITYQNILGPGRPLEGIGESNITAGLHVKGGLSFEFGTFKSNVSGLEIGVMLEAFPQKVILLPRAENRAIFPSAYFTLFHGSRK